VVAFLLVAWALGIGRPGLVAAAPVVCALLAMAVAAPTTAFAATVRDDSAFHLMTQFGVVPATAVSGVFFPVDRLPDLLEPVAYLSPLWHATELNRAAALGGVPAWPVPVHLAVLLVWAVAGFGWARAAFRRRLAG
jgi:lipooligosaccharide transport system permease protein